MPRPRLYFPAAARYWRQNQVPIRETEKAALEKFASGTADYLDMYAEEYDKAKEGSNSTITLTAEDAGKSMLGMLTSMDFSWLNSVSLDMDVSILESMEAMAVDVLMNDAHLCSMNIMMDLGNLAQYIQMPEFSEDWISVPLTMTDANGEEVSPEAWYRLITISCMIS